MELQQLTSAVALALRLAAFEELDNPYLESFLALDEEERWRYEQRNAHTITYAWAIPNAEALATIARYGPIVEIGAGNGYWASLLRAGGVDIVAYDIEPPDHDEHTNKYHTHLAVRQGKVAQQGHVWTEVLRSDEAVVLEHQQRTLMLCWPPYRDPVAFNALVAYTGNTLLYVGEGRGGCTGDNAFHELLATDWHEVEFVLLPRWEGIRDYLSVYRRDDTDDTDEEHEQKEEL